MFYKKDTREIIENSADLLLLTINLKDDKAVLDAREAFYKELFYNDSKLSAYDALKQMIGEINFLGDLKYQENLTPLKTYLLLNRSLEAIKYRADLRRHFFYFFCFINNFNCSVNFSDKELIVKLLSFFQDMRKIADERAAANEPIADFLKKRNLGDEIHKTINTNVYLRDGNKNIFVCELTINLGLAHVFNDFPTISTDFKFSSSELIEEISEINEKRHPIIEDVIIKDGTPTNEIFTEPTNSKEYFEWLLNKTGFIGEQCFPLRIPNASIGSYQSEYRKFCIEFWEANKNDYDKISFSHITANDTDDYQGETAWINKRSR